MKIYGDLSTADKYYVKMEDGSVIWTSNLTLAKKYVSNERYKDWFGKDIYATNEDLTIVNNKLKLNSTLTFGEINNIEFSTVINTFLDQINNYIEDTLETYAKQNGFKSLLEMISWYNSSIEFYSNKAKEAVEYRDTLYTYRLSFLESDFMNKVKEKQDSDLSELYTKFIENFPSFDNDESGSTED